MNEGCIKYESCGEIKRYIKGTRYKGQGTRDKGQGARKKRKTDFRVDEKNQVVRGIRGKVQGARKKYKDRIIIR